jgi:hypothetical protein
MTAGILALQATTPASAQHESKTLAKSGAFAIDYIKEKGRFDRCAATLHGGPGMLRIALTKAGKFSISVPPAPAAKGLPLLMTFHLPNGVMTYDALTNAQRAWAVVDDGALPGLQRSKGNLTISLGTRKFIWSIGNTSMNNVFTALESCATRP